MFISNSLLCPSLWKLLDCWNYIQWYLPTLSKQYQFLIKLASGNDAASYKRRHLKNDARKWVPGIILAVQGGRRVRATNWPPSLSLLCRKRVSLDVSETYGSPMGLLWVSAAYFRNASPPICSKIDWIFAIQEKERVEITKSFQLKQNSMVWVRERIIPTEGPPLVGEVIANFCW
jgi:hypothetical protein